MPEILISVGSNINKEQNTQSGLDALCEIFDDVRISPIYESESVGFAGETFLNLVVRATTSQSVAQVCDNLKLIEQRHGRTRTEKKFSSRTLDLDLLTYDTLVCEHPVVLPRPEILYNAFVLLPLSDIVPHYEHPVTGQTYQALWKAYDQRSQPLWVAEFTWSCSRL